MYTKNYNWGHSPRNGLPYKISTTFSPSKPPTTLPPLRTHTKYTQVDKSKIFIPVCSVMRLLKMHLLIMHYFLASLTVCRCIAAHAAQAKYFHMLIFNKKKTDSNMRLMSKWLLATWIAKGYRIGQRQGRCINILWKFHIY